MSGSSSRPDWVGETPRTICRYTGRNTMAPNMAKPMMNPMALATEKIRLRNSRSGRIGSAARPSHHTNSADSTTPATSRPEISAVPQPTSLTADQAEQQAGHAADHERGAEVVDAVLAPDVLEPVQRAVGDDQRDDAQRDVDEEDPVPGQVVDEEPAEQRTGDRGDGEHRAEVALVATPLPRGDDVADDRERQRHETAGAEALDAPRRDELPHLGGQPGQHRADEEHDDGEAEHRLAAVEVGDLAVQGRGRRRGQQVGRDHPGQVLQATEVADDRRQRGGHDRLVERGQQHAGHQPGKDHQDLPVGELGGDDAAGLGRCVGGSVGHYSSVVS